MKRNRSGLSLLEVVVVLGCALIVFSLLIPATNGVRDGHGRRGQCSTQLKNFSLAAIQYENARGRFPGWVMDFGNFGWDPETETVLEQLNDPSSAQSGPLERAAEGLVPHRKVGTWAVALLPWLDAQPTYEHWTEDRYPILTRGEGATQEQSGTGFHPLATPQLAILQCPNDPNSDGEDNGRNSYIANTGVYFPPSDLIAGTHSIFHPGGTAKEIGFEESMSVEFGVFGNQLSARAANSDEDLRVPVAEPIGLDDFKDGAGYTVLFSESLHAMPWHRAGFVNDVDLMFERHPDEVMFPPLSRFTNGMVWHGVDWSNGKKPREIHLINGNRSLTESMLMDRGNATDLARPSSAHTDGVNVSMADGGTRYVSDSIDPRVWQALMTPRGREEIPEDAL
ncbi:DUF1559 domain-containing protein [Rhodopirellula sp. JC740]|uniref:DUF1559 domain-containing protein n=1 Tax=Rhodopirellula halodulae TaxID=2894198 RepID=A0ABS8NG30_9BACT|nr:DUF1559 domain-containing protein [Rhodopirellula sp. JC740]MCC9642498.1 DUF1559 domain-containing protein [Rhodopirellula sp. JC740]